METPLPEELYLQIRNSLQKLIGSVEDKSTSKEEAEGGSVALSARIDKIKQELGMFAVGEAGERLDNLSRLSQLLRQVIARRD